MAKLTSTNTALIQDVLRFWFQDATPQQWFMEDTTFDQKIIDRFSKVYEQAAGGEFDHWAQDPEGLVALVIILDQFPRNMFRGDKRTYATDQKAVQLTKMAIHSGLDQSVTDKNQKHFLYIPLMHSESRDDQALSVKMFQDNEDALKWAQHHKEIVDRFGRFPHRNKLLDRQSTPEELEFLKQSDFKT